MSIIIFFAVLFVLVLVHELGHFAVAKWTGMRVDEFGIGFPPKLFGVKKGETEYTFNLFPVGGFVKIFGENYDDLGENATPTDTHTPRSFLSKSRWAQSAVLLAGITMNILFAWILIGAAFNIGVETEVTEAEATPNAKLIITGTLPESPATQAGLTSGDVIQSVGAGDETLAARTPSAFSAFVSMHPNETVAVAYTRSGELRVAQLVPKTNVISNDPGRPAVGVALTLTDTLNRSLFESVSEATSYTLHAISAITIGILGLLADTVRFNADLSQVAGPVGIVGLVGDASAHGITALLMFTAFISLNLAVVNLLPIPALDGGRFLFVLIEAVKGSPISPKYAATLNAIGFIFLILLMVAVTWSDIAKLL